MAAREIALGRKLEIVGVLGILGVAAKHGIVVPTAIARLQRTTFRASASLIQSLLERYSADG